MNLSITIKERPKITKRHSDSWVENKLTLANRKLTNSSSQNCDNIVNKRPRKLKSKSWGDIGCNGRVSKPQHVTLVVLSIKVQIIENPEMFYLLYIHKCNRFNMKCKKNHKNTTDWIIQDENSNHKPIVFCYF